MLKRLTRKLVILSVLVAASLAVFASGRAKASSQYYWCPYGHNCLYTTTYYSDYTHSQIVGTCNGSTCEGWEFCQGVKTEYWMPTGYTVVTCN